MAKIEKKFSESILNLTNRSKLTLTGVERVVATNSTRVHVYVSGSALKISGQKLHVEKLDVENGLLRLDGVIDEIKYDHQKVSLIKRLFR